MTDGFFQFNGRIESAHRVSPVQGGLQFNTVLSPTQFDAEEGWIMDGVYPPETRQFYTSGVKDGVHYDFAVRCRNSLGVFSNWAVVRNHKIIGKTEPPTVPTNLQARRDLDRGAIIISWTEISDLDRSHYEIALTDVDSGTTTIKAKPKNSPFIYIDDFPPQSEDKTVKIRSVDTTGNVSAWTDAVAFKTPCNGQGLLELTFTALPNTPPTAQIDYYFPGGKPDDLVEVRVYRGTGLRLSFTECTQITTITVFPYDYGAISDLNTDLSANSYTYWFEVVTSSWTRGYKIYAKQQ